MQARYSEADQVAARARCDGASVLDLARLPRPREGWPRSERAVAMNSSDDKNFTPSGDTPDYFTRQGPATPGRPYAATADRDLAQRLRALKSSVLPRDNQPASLADLGEILDEAAGRLEGQG